MGKTVATKSTMIVVRLPGTPAALARVQSKPKAEAETVRAPPRAVSPPENMWLSRTAMWRITQQAFFAGAADLARQADDLQVSDRRLNRTHRNPTPPDRLIGFILPGA